MASALQRAWRNRMISALSVGVGLALSHHFWGLADERGAVVYRFTATVGYGHLLGAAWPTAMQAGSGVGVRIANITWWAVTCLTGLAIYAAVVEQAPWLVLLVLAASVWHTVENDAELPTVYGGSGRLGPVVGSRRRDAGVLLGTVCLIGLALVTEDAPSFATLVTPEDHSRSFAWRTGLAARMPFQLADLFAAVTLYHLASWLIILIDRSRALCRAGHRQAGALLGRRLLAFHVGPVVVVAGAAWLQPSHWLLGFILSPAVYLYWSALHVVHTSVGRHRSSIRARGTP